MPSSVKALRLHHSKSEALFGFGSSSPHPKPTPQAEPSVAQGLPALEHAPEDNLDASRRADALDPAVGPFALAVVGLVLVAPRLEANLLQAPRGHGAGEAEGQLPGP